MGTRYSKVKSIKTHDNVSIPASDNVISDWIDCQGFDKLAFNLNQGADFQTAAYAIWSDNKTESQGSEVVLSTNSYSTDNSRTNITEVKSSFVKIRLDNKDTTLAHVMNAWVYLRKIGD